MAPAKRLLTWSARTLWRALSGGGGGVDQDEHLIGPDPAQAGASTLACRPFGPVVELETYDGASVVSRRAVCVRPTCPGPRGDDLAPRVSTFFRGVREPTTTTTSVSSLNRVPTVCPIERLPDRP